MTELTHMQRHAALMELLPLVLNAVDAENTRRVYRQQLIAFFEWYQQAAPGPFSKAVVQAYIAHMRRARKSASTCNQAITALRKLAEEAADNGLLIPEIANGVAKVKTIKQLGRKTGTWLSIEQARALIAVPDHATLKGKRDRVLIGLLLECGLRREEAAELTVEQIQEREGRMVLVDLKGKGGRVRTVPVPWRTAGKIGDYLEAARITTGRVLRPVNKADRLEDSEGITPTAIYKQVRQYAQMIDVDIRPHDLRRTFGKLARDGGAEIDQIRESLGHSDTRTTEIYLGERQRLESGAAPCDKIDLGSNEETHAKEKRRK